jgi:prepilin-type N-terminal cleavage/methylation domain-containing protein
MNLKTSKGFTIVELLIVIVVIAILAAISIVAYTGVQDRARNSAAAELAGQFAGKAQAYQALTGNLPTSISGGQFNGYVAADHAEADISSMTSAPAKVTQVAAGVVVGSSITDTNFRNGTAVQWNPTTQAVLYRTGGAATANGSISLN